jgi:hypothetical protein
MKLNRDKPFGRISGTPFIPRDCTEVATYEQDGRFFNQFDEEIVPPGKQSRIVPGVNGEADRSLPSKAKSAAKAKAETAAKAGDAEKQATARKAQAEKNMAEQVATEQSTTKAKQTSPEYTAADLLAQCDSMPWAMFNNEAKRVLGQTCPAGKDAIIAELRAAAEGAATRAARRSARYGKGEEAAPDSSAPPAQQPPAAGGIDLAMWAMGKQDYLWPHVRSAIRAKYSRVVEKRRDAVHLLVDEKLIPGNLARRDFENSDK